MFPKGYLQNYQSPTAALAAKGPAGTAQAAAADWEAAQDFLTSGKAQFAAASTAMYQYKLMGASLETLSQHSGFLTPGFGMRTRVEIANAVNTMAQALGKTPPINPDAVASAEEFTKQTGLLVTQLAKSNYGQSHLAASVIDGIGRTVPSYENTTLGAKLLLDGYKEGSQREMDYQIYRQGLYAAGKSLVGADVSFNQLHPASQYADKILKQYGIGEDHKFQSPAAVMAAFRGGLLSREDVNRIGETQFGFKPKGASE
jgi:hypothetical protein